MTQSYCSFQCSPFAHAHRRFTFLLIGTRSLARIVGRTAIAVAIFSLLPFVVLVLWGLPDCTMPESWLSPPDGGWGAIRWGPYLNVMFW